VGYVVGNDRDADDMVQSTMIEILRALPSYKATGKLESWADRITVRTCMKLLKKRSSKVEVSFLDEDEDIEPTRLMWQDPAAGGAREENAESCLAQKQIRRRLAALLQELPPKRRTVAALRWVFDYRPPEIAEMTGTSVNTVRDHLQKGKRQLRKIVLEDAVLAEWMKWRTEASR
jgi:RNA polymerase sigma-70 factor (ECF subfamily)